MSATKIRSAIDILENRITPAAFLGLTDLNKLVAFDSAFPGVTELVAVTGMGADEVLVGIDFRPANGALYGIAVDGVGAGHAYLINPVTGVATLSATLVADPADTTNPFTLLSGTNFGVDFNPVPDRLRIISDTNQNLRVNVDTGFVTTDVDLSPMGSTIAGVAYTNSFAGATSTNLHDIDVTWDQLFLQNPPNNGTLTNPLPLGVDATGVGGFDILSSRAANGTVTNAGFAALTVGGATGLFALNLSTGAATSLGLIGNGSVPLRGLTSASAWSDGVPSASAFSVHDGNALLRFNVATPSVTTSIGTITGTGPGETVVGIDFRPATGALYALTKDGSNTGRLYTVNTSTAAATFVANLAADPTDPTAPYTSLAGGSFGIDFNPVADRLRVVSSSGENLRVNVATGAVITDNSTNGATGSTSAAAYTNSYAGASTTSLFVIDAVSDSLYLQNPPNNGTLSLIGSLGIDASSINGFDIRPNGQAFASFTVGGVPTLYSINLTTGAATPVGAIQTPGGETRGLALAPSGSLQFSAPELVLSEGVGTATLTINRIGGSEGIVSILVNTSDSEAVAGTDYTRVSRVVTFASGVTSQVISIPILNDAELEQTKAFLVTLSEPAGGASLASTSDEVGITILNDDAKIVNSKVATFIDRSGDLVTIKTSAGTLTPANIVLVPGGVFGGATLARLDLTTGGFEGANITITAKPANLAGDGFVNVGHLDATGVPLGKVLIDGDLGQIDAGPVKSLAVQSLGRFGASAQLPGGSMISEIAGNLGRLSVKTDIVGARLAVDGNIGPASVMGNLIGTDVLGIIAATGNIGAVKIGGNITGGPDAHSGSIEAQWRIASVTVGGSVQGGAGVASGSIIARSIGALKVGGDIQGGSIFVSGNFHPEAPKLAVAMGSLTVTGNITLSEILIGFNREGQPVNADVQVGAVKAGGDWSASNLAVGIAANDGIFGNTNDSVIPNGDDTIARIASIAIRGQVTGTIDISNDGFGFVAEVIGAFRVGKTKIPIGTALPSETALLGETGDTQAREVVSL